MRLVQSPGSAMKLFECQACGHPLYFENTSCGSCGRSLDLKPEASHGRTGSEPVASAHDRRHDNAQVRAKDPARLCATGQGAAAEFIPRSPTIDWLPP